MFYKHYFIYYLLIINEVMPSRRCCKYTLQFVNIYIEEFSVAYKTKKCRYKYSIHETYEKKKNYNVSSYSNEITHHYYIALYFNKSCHNLMF